ncbi:MAG TPA: tetratricopeptide repeat protein [Nitrospira sp.]|nr:tetratricopeptide repeat protein [Nitrospira sp.]
MKRQLTLLMLCVLATGFLGCGGPEERKAKYRNLAQEYIQAGNYPKARVALRNVLKIDPKDADAYFLFAQVEEKEKNWRNAVKLYQEVVELVPDHSGALITLAKYYLEARLGGHVTAAADKVLAKHPRHPQALALKIAVLGATDDKVPDAVSKAEALSAEFPAEPDVAILLATLYRQQRRYAEAESVLRRALQTHSHEMDLLNNLHNTLLEAGDTRGGEAVIRVMIEAEPASFDHRLKLARLFDTTGAQREAESVLREAVALDPDSESRRLMLADFLVTRKDVSAAEQALLEAVGHLPHSGKLQFALSGLYRRHGAADKARARYLELIDEYQDKPIGLEAKVKLAEMDLEEGRQAEAERGVSEALKENPRSAEALTLSGKIALANHNGKDAVQAFRTVLHDQPEQAGVQFLLGQAYLLTKEPSLARESFERAVALYPGQVDARRSLAVLESQSGRHREARARLDDLLKQRPDDVAALEMLISLDLLTGNLDEAGRTLERLRGAAGASYSFHMAEGRYFQAQGKLDEAAAAYGRATTLAPNDVDALLAVIKLDIARGRVAQAQKRLETILAANPTHRFGHGLLGEVLTLAGQYGLADEQFREATRIHPKWTAPWIDWASMWMAQKEPGRAVQIIQAGLSAAPESEELSMLLASAQSDAGRMDAAIQAYEATLRINPRNILAANNLAVLLVDYKRDQASLQKAFALSRDFEKEAPHPAFLDTLAWVRLKMGHQEEALRLLRAAVGKSPEASVINYHLGMAYYQSGKASEARDYLAKSLKVSEAFPGREEAEQVLAQIRG